MAKGNKNKGLGLEDEEWFQDMQRLSSYKKARTYLKGLAEDPKFKVEVKKIRKKYKIPTDGYKKIIIEQGERGSYMKNPEHLAENKAFHKRIEKFTSDLGLPYLWGDVITHYVVYNSLNVLSVGSMIETQDAYWMKEHLKKPPAVDLKGLTAETDEKDDKFYQHALLEFMAEEAKAKPVAILVSPYANQKDILDYVRKMYKQDIEPIQKKYRKEGVKYGKFKEKDALVQKRNKFIYEHRHLPKDELKRLVSDTFHELEVGSILDHAYLAKIIRDEKEKRK